MDFKTYAAFCPLSPEKQAESDRRERADAERTATKQVDAEPMRVAKELEQP